MLEQALAYSAAVAVMLVLIWVPGALVGYAGDVFGFRKRPAEFQLALGLLLSLSVCPIVVYLLVRLGGFRAVWIAYALVWAAAAILSIRHAKQIGAALRQIGQQRGFWLLVAGWFLICGFSEIDVLTSQAVHLNLNSIDAIAHVAFTNAITRTGVPPDNPFVYPAGPVHLFYYYLWYLICSLADQLGGAIVTARAAVQAGTFYVGLGVASLISVYVATIGPQIIPIPRKIRTGVGIALLAITGLDLIPWFFLYFMKSMFDKGSGAGTSIEWWNEQVTAWLGAIIMSPHHPTGMIICFTAMLLMLHAMRLPAGAGRLGLLSIAAVAMASAAGVSLYVTFAFGLGLALWAATCLVRGWGRNVADLAGVAVVAVCLYLPFAAELRAASAVGGFPVAFTVRAFGPVDYWLPSILHILKTHPGILYILRAVLLPLNYFFELGFFLIAAVLYWRWRRSLAKPLEKEEIAMACLAAGSILVCTFLRSTFRWNDLGWRGFLVAQFVLLLWAIPLVQELLERRGEPRLVGARWPRLAWLCLVVGLAGTVWELTSFRINADGPQGPETAALREAYMWVDQHTPQDAVVLFNPDVSLDFFSSLYGYRQAVSAGRAYGTYFAVAGDAEQVLQDSIDAFVAGPDADRMLAVCRRYHASAIVVSSADPVWNQSGSWVWQYRPSFSTDRSRVFTPDDLAPEHRAGAPAAR